MQIKLVIIILVLSLVITGNLSCASNKDDAQLKKSLKKAGEVLGIEIPWPHYLPEGYKINSVYAIDSSEVSLIISDNNDKLIELDIIHRARELM